MVLSQEPSVKSVREKGEALLELVQDVALKDKIDTLQSDYQDLCQTAKVSQSCRPRKPVFSNRWVPKPFLSTGQL